MKAARYGEPSEDFDEADFLYGQDGGADPHASHEDEGSSSSWIQQDERPRGAASSSRAHADAGPGSNRSNTTTIMQDIIHEEEPIEVFHTAAMPIAASLPSMRHVRMGTSAPMNVPFLGGKAIKEEKDVEEDDEMPYPGTFIPPHQLSQHDGFMFSLTGASPSVAKKERLRARNAILASTGFLEHQEATPIQARAKFVAKTTGGLSQALQSPTCPQ